MRRKRFFHLCLVMTVILAGLAVPLFQTSVAFAASPDTPSNVSPSDNATGISLTPNLASSPFNDSDNNKHFYTDWQITTTLGNYSPGHMAWQRLGDTENLTSIVVPSGQLYESTTYYWRVSYWDNNTEQSPWSAETSFTTLDATAPLISDVAATGITATSATITWTTDEQATSQVEYSVDTIYN